MSRDTFTEDYEFEVSKNSKGGYSVSLPHQCDEWEIVGADIDKSEPQPTEYTNNYPSLPKNKDLAVEQMELFIKRAEEALQKLKTL